jgi:hypothetical protein
MWKKIYKNRAVEKQKCTREINMKRDWEVVGPTRVWRAKVFRIHSCNFRRSLILIFKVFLTNFYFLWLTSLFLYYQIEISLSIIWPTNRAFITIIMQSTTNLICFD